MLRYLGWGLFALLLSGCGQKGDLYLPQSKNPAQHSSSKAQSSAATQSSASSAATSSEAKAAH